MARTTLITPIFLSPKPSSDDVELGLHLRRPRQPPPSPLGAAIDDGAASGRLDAVDFFEVIAQFLGLLQRRADDLVARAPWWKPRIRAFFHVSCHRRRNFLSLGGARAGKVCARSPLPDVVGRNFCVKIRRFAFDARRERRRR